MINQEQLTTMMVLGKIVQDDLKIDQKIEKCKERYIKVVHSLTPINLMAITEVVAAEWRARYGDEDDSINYRHRDAMRTEIQVGEHEA